MGKIFTAIMRFIFKKTIPKFFLFFGLYFLVAEFVPVLFEMMGGDRFIANLGVYLSNIPSGVAYFLAPFRLDLGIKMVAAAYITRFIIRRIPFMG